MNALSETILYLEKELLRPEVRCSAEKIAGILSDSFCEYTSSGTEYHYRKGDTFPGGPVTDGDWEIIDFSVLALSPGSAQAVYKLIKHTDPDISRRLSLRSSLWVMESGIWKMQFHQGTAAG